MFQVLIEGRLIRVVLITSIFTPQISGVLSNIFVQYKIWCPLIAKPNSKEDSLFKQK